MPVVCVREVIVRQGSGHDACGRAAVERVFG